MNSVGVVCLGELLVDMFPAGSGRRLVEVSAFRPESGGAPANVAVSLARLVKKGAWREMLSPEEMRQDLRYANAVGASTSQKLGVIPALPTAEAVDDFLAGGSGWKE